MNNTFTKEEAVQYLGEVLMFKNEYTHLVDDKPQSTVNSGEVAKITSVDIWDGEIKLCLDIYGNYYSLNKRQFLNHCVLLKPEIIAHQASDKLSH